MSEPTLQDVLKTPANIAERERFAAEIEQAREDVMGSDEIEIDDEPLLSVADEGVWISAWLWIPRKDTQE